MSERDNALIFCLCVISCTILFAAATIIKLLNQKRRVRYNRVELDKEVTQNATGTESVRIGSGIVASNRLSSSEDSLVESKPARKSSESSHPSNPITGELKDSLKNDENSSQKEISSKPQPSLDIISSLKKNLHDFRDGLDSNSRSIEVPKRDSPSMEAETDDGTSLPDKIASMMENLHTVGDGSDSNSRSIEVPKRDSPSMEAETYDGTQGETTSDKESVRSRSGSASSNGSHKIEDDSTGPKSSHSKPIDTMHQHSSKIDEDSSEDDDTSHSPQHERTSDKESVRSRSGSDDSNRSDTSEDDSTGQKSSHSEPIDTMHQNSSKNDEDSSEYNNGFSSSYKMCSIL